MCGDPSELGSEVSRFRGIVEGEGELSPKRGQVLNFICTALANCFLAGGVYALLSEQLGASSSVALAVALLVAFGLQFWIGRLYVNARKRDPSQAAEVRFVIWALIGMVLLVKLVYVGLLDLAPEEAYYWQYAQRPALGYLDHPVMVAWGILAGTTLFGDTELGVRVFTLLCWLVTAGFMAGLTRDLFGKKTASAAFVLTCLLPYTFVFGLFATPDAPLMASWAGALFYFQRATIGDRRLAWVGFGICMGFGMLSKYSMVLLAPAALIFLILDKPSRKWFVRPDPYLAILWSLLIFSPVLIWNYQHDWASFAYQSERRMNEDPEFNLHKLLAYSLLLVTPWGVLGSITAFLNPTDWTKAGASADTNARRRRLMLFLAWLVPFAVFALSSLTRRTKMSWTGPAWLAVIPVLATLWMHRPKAALVGIPWLRSSQWRGVLIFLLVAYAGAFHYMTLGLPGIPYRQHGVKPVAWEEFGAQVQALAEQIEAEERQAGGHREVYVVGTDRFPIASELAFYRRAGERVKFTTRTAFFYGGQGVMYETWFKDPPPADILMLFVSFKKDLIEDPRIQAHVRDLGDVQLARVTKKGKPAGSFYYRIGRGYIRSRD